MSAAGFVRFNLVGALGIAVQIALLALLTRAFAVNYLAATAIAVSITVVHNFLWHERYTFSERIQDKGSRAMKAVAMRFMKFNLITGLVSLAGNVLLMRWLCQRARLPLVAANLLAIAVCGLFNYLANDKLVFPRAASGALIAGRGRPYG